MEAKIAMIIKRISRLSYVLGSICLLAGLILSFVKIPASAAELGLQDDAQETACTPPKDWDQTTRFNRQNPSKEWTFTVEEPGMDVELEFFWYQDYDPEGCPFDCVNTDECQDYETGDVESPLGNFSITDGKEDPDGGTAIQSGTLPQGEYKVKFTFTGGRGGPLMGSINVGFKARTSSAEPETPTPTDMPALTETPPPTILPPAAQTPTPTGTTAATTSTVTPGSPEPSDTPAPTATGTLATQTPTTTSTPIVLPPESSPTPTDVESTPPATLSPPTPPPGATRTPAIIPVTGLDLAYGSQPSFPTQNQFLNLGIGFLGLGLVFHGISRKFNKR